MSALLELQGVGVAFGGMKAVDELSLSIEEGHIAALIGPNGAGKTTVFNLITGVSRPSEGRILWQGQDITGLAPHRIAGLGIRRTFQTIRLFSGMTVFENVRAGSHLRVRQSWWQGLLGTPFQRREEASITAHTHDILRKLDLDGVADEMATSLPYGLQRRVEMARALAAQPKLLILDEPAAGLNDAESAELNQTMFAIRDMGVTILLVEHDMNVVMNVTDHIVVINFGRKIAEGDATAVQDDPAVIEAYLGRDDDDEEQPL